MILFSRSNKSSYLRALRLLKVLLTRNLLKWGTVLGGIVTTANGPLQSIPQRRLILMTKQLGNGTCVSIIARTSVIANFSNMYLICPTLSRWRVNPNSACSLRIFSSSLMHSLTIWAIAITSATITIGFLG